MDKIGDANNIHISKANALLLLWLVTVTVMWVYVVFCYYGFGGWGIVPGGGMIFSLIHSLAPFVFYKSGSLAMTGMLISFTGLCFQTLFCIYSGGILSPAAIWLPLHPVMLAFFANIPTIMTSVTINAIILISLYLFEIYALLPQDCNRPF